MNLRSGINNEHLVDAARNFRWIKYPRDIRIIRSLEKIDRKDFLPKSTKEYAYLDAPIEIGYEGTCSQPSLTALMFDMLELKTGMDVLEIGTGSGYSSAWISYLIWKGKLTTLEIVSELSVFARSNLEKHFGSLEGKIDVICMDGSIGYQKNAPYDRIYLTAAPFAETFKPEILLSQLKDKGILLYPTRRWQNESYGSLVIYKKDGLGLGRQEYSGVVFVPLKGKNI